MKNRSVYWFVLIFLVAGFKTITLLGQQWSPPIRISGGRTPDLDIDPKTGHLHIISMYNGVTYTNVAADGTILFQESVPGANSDEGGWRFGASVSVDTLGCPYVCYRIFKDPDLYDGYYTYRTASGWSTPVRLFKDVKRGYVFRIDIDSQNRAHIARGSAEDNVWGTVTYYRLINGQYSREEGGFTKYRADDRLEIDSGPNNNVHLILGCPDDNGGPVTYWRSINGGDSWVRIGDIHHPEAGGRNGSPDLFVDKMGTVHICYGSANDASRGNTPSARYARFENGNKIRDLAVTDTGELTSWHHGGGLASVAASDNGQYVVMAYLTTDGGALVARL
ncbi:MAG: hypothetical protein ONB05_09095, partial [candidate division KSB1 bacterium]|nr:hypothetical protein [candidate division KSB1 bacterium]